mmetsp:Transcript_12940/g.18475  ORF Transcript_12940/g.18475 Transcript_12940/m.18475 type:complete len:100 (-) Transcript_12940:1484-1783(-)
MFGHIQVEPNLAQFYSQYPFGHGTKEAFDQPSILAKLCINNIFVNFYSQNICQSSFMGLKCISRLTNAKFSFQRDNGKAYHFWKEFLGSCTLEFFARGT